MLKSMIVSWQSTKTNSHKRQSTVALPVTQRLSRAADRHFFRKGLCCRRVVGIGAPRQLNGSLAAHVGISRRRVGDAYGKSSVGPVVDLPLPFASHGGNTHIRPDGMGSPMA